MKIIKFGTITKKGNDLALSNFEFDSEGEIPTAVACLSCIINELNHIYYSQVNSHIAKLTAVLQKKDVKPTIANQHCSTVQKYDVELNQETNIISFKDAVNKHHDNKKL